jgi:hypothetical protein
MKFGATGEAYADLFFAEPSAARDSAPLGRKGYLLRSSALQIEVKG